MYVWVTDGPPEGAYRRHYHMHYDCYSLRAGLARHGSTAVQVARGPQSQALLPCRTCWGDPTPETFKRFCRDCDSWRACPHNGGVLVKTKVGQKFVWPERAKFHDPLAEPSG